MSAGSRNPDNKISSVEVLRGCAIEAWKAMPRVRRVSHGLFRSLKESCFRVIGMQLWGYARIWSGTGHAGKVVAL